MDTALRTRLMRATPEQRIEIMMNERPEDIWGGKHRDFAEMCDLAVKKPVLHRIFSTYSILAFATTITYTWGAVYFGSYTGFVNGGPVTLVYGTVVSFLGALATAASLAEMASAMPTAGGQFHWTYKLAPHDVCESLSWLTGWLSVMGWMAALSTTGYFAGTVTQAIIIAYCPNVAYERWQGTLMIWAALLLPVAINVFLTRFMAHIERLAVFFYVLGFATIVIVLTGQTPEVHGASFAFTNATIRSGYSSNGLSFLVGLISTNLLFLGLDGPCHMIEEVKNASNTVPWTMVSAVFINGFLALGTVIAFVFCLGDPQEYLTNAQQTGYGFALIFSRTRYEELGAAWLTALVILFVICASLCVLAAASRQTWAFARDNGLPFSKVFSKTHFYCGTRIPLRAIWLCTAAAATLSLINLAPAATLNIIVSLTIACLFTSYLIPIVAMIHRRLSPEEIRYGLWHLGRYGMAVNMVSILYLTISIIFSFFPPMLPVTSESMNWSPLLFPVLVVAGLVYYRIRARKIWRGPIPEDVNLRAVRRRHLGTPSTQGPSLELETLS